MALSVLGKRARAPESIKEESSSVKRRALQSVNDENLDPNLVQLDDDCHQDGYGKVQRIQDDLDALDDPFRSSTRKSAGAIYRSTKLNQISPRVALSPTKANGQSKTFVPDTEAAVPKQLLTPQTPRHRNALSKKVPITPCRRLSLAGKCSTPRTPRTPGIPSNTVTVYNSARQLFARSVDPGRLVGRDAERNQLSSFVTEGIRSKTGRCLYVSGPPGTGKSALVSEVCREIEGIPAVRTAHINCMIVKDPKEIYHKLACELIDDSPFPEANEVEVLRKAFLSQKTSSGPVYVVTLDEIDHLLTLDLEILHTLFGWSLCHSSRLVLIAIANALDLTDRFLPRLKAKNLKPQLLPFLPYTASQIASVITTKLRSLCPVTDPARAEHTPFVHPAAIQLCSKKVASQTGDLRKAFDIIRRTIDLIEAETKQKYQGDSNYTPPDTPSKKALNENLSSTCPVSSDQKLATSLSTLTPDTAPCATIAHVARVSASALGHGTSQRLKSLNLQQKAALCALISLEKSNRLLQSSRSLFSTPSKSSSTRINPAPALSKLFQKYCELCRSENALHPLTRTEFADVLGGLETLGLIGRVDGKGTPGRKGRAGRDEGTGFVAWVGEKEMEGYLEGLEGSILRSLLQ